MSKQPFKDRQNARLILEELEERRLFSGGVEGLLDSGLDAGAIYRDAEDSRSDSSGDAAAAADAEYQTRELVFVDTRVDDYEALVDSLVQSSDRSHQIEVVILERERDGIEQISTALAAYDDLDAVHLISHGSDGSIQLGDTLLDSATLEQNQAGVALWANAFTETGDILIYGCNLAASEAGQSLINELAGLTLADVAASDDLTGHASLGGDWELEHAVGSIESEVAISAETQAQWSAVLAATADDAFEYPVGSLAGNGGGSGWSGAWSGGSSNFQVVNTGLDHPTGGLETSGGAVELNAPGFTFPGMTERDLSSALGAADETIWASFLLQPDEITDPNNSYMGLAFGTGGIANTNQLFVGYSGTNFKLNDWGGGGVNVDVPGVVSGQTYFLVLKLDLSASGNESATLYVNPTAGETTPDVAGSAVKADLDLGTFSTISIAGGRDGATNASLLDQIRIGSNYLDVAPSNPPDITSDGGGPTASLNVDENTTYVTTVTAADPDLDTPTFTITGGDDQAHFDVDLNSGVLSFKNAPNFEAPTDTGTNNSYEVVVTASDGKGGSDSQTITVTVDDVGELTVAVDDAVSVSEDAVHNSASGWFDSNWQYRQTLSFDNSVSTENLTDFPVLIKLDSSKIDYAKTHDQGDDLRFFDQDGAALAHEIELWDESGTSYVWVKVPQIDAASNTDSILMYYGNAAVAGNGQDPAGVWSDFRAAYHLHEDPGGAGTVSDSAGNYDATNSGSVDSAGYIGNAQDFNGVDQHIDLGDNRNWINNATASTLSIWMNADSVAGSGDLIGLTRNDPADTGASRITLIQNGDDIQLIARTMDDNSDSVSVVTTSNPLTAGTWHHVTGTVDYASDVNNIKIYVDGVLHGNFSHDFTNNAIPNTDSSHATIGSDEDGVSSFFGGQLDEARIASTLRSADWIAAQYASMTDNFVTLGAEQTAHGVLANDIDFEGDSLTVTQVNGAAGAVGVPTALASGAILTLNADGSFVYDPNGAFEALDVGETAFDSFTYQVGDGFGNFDTATATITVNGAEDAPVIGGTATGTVAEDGTLTATDTLTVTDADTSDNPISFNDVAATLGDNGYGNFEITSNTWTYTLNNGHASVQALDVGETLNDTFTFTASDGSTQVVTVTINGAEDAAVIGGTATGSVAEDGTLTATDTLTITDADTSDNPISFNDVAATLGDNGYGNFEITSNTWTYTLNNGHASVQALDVGETLNDTFTFTASDGSTQVVTVTINGAEDAPVIGGTATGSVAEDGTLTTSDTLTITDADTSDNPISFNDIAPTLGDNGYGNFEITGNTWTYTLNNGHALVQALDVGETLTDTHTFTASDGSTRTVTITIDGAEDMPTLDNPIADQNATEGAAFSFTIPANAFGDVDSSDTLAYSAALAGGGPLPAWLSFDGPTRSFSGTPGAADVGVLDIRITADDGSSTVDDVFTLTIAPFNNLPVIGGVDSGAVTEDRNLVAGQLTESGALTIADPDPGESSFVATTINGALGTLVIDAAGNWAYSANNGQPEIQALNAGESITDTMTVTTADGTTHDIVITIDGVSEAATPPPPQPPAPEPPPEVEEPEEAPEVEAPTSEGATSEPPEIVRMPQETVLPARDEPEAVAPAEAEPAAPPERPAVQPAATVRVAANSPFGLNLAQLKLQVSDDVAVNDQFEHALLEHIERMHAAIDSDSERKLAEDIQVQILLGTSASLTAGIVSWVLRGGSLLASLMSTVPLLNRFDPLPILKSKEEREKVTEKDDATDDTQSPQHERRVDAMFADQEAER